MPSRFFDRLTPKAASRTRRLTAAMVWTSAGVFLVSKGIWISREAQLSNMLWGMLPGAGLGLLKGKLILDRVAKRIILHIGSKPQRSCLGGLFSFRNWMLILLMAVFGRTLATLISSNTLKTCIYVMVGTGLGFSSRLLWDAWKRSPRAEARQMN